MNYTKGEWEVGVSDIIGTGNDREHIVVGLKENLHKIIAATGFAGADDESESIANANLISAAPDMYQALKEISDLRFTRTAYTQNGQSMDDCAVISMDALEKVIKLLKNVLAKAEGK